VIDWITATVKIDHLPAMGMRTDCDKDGAIQRVSRIPEHVPSSSTTIFCVVVGDDLLISGNPTKFYQSHNLISVDHWSLIEDFFCDVCARLECVYQSVVKITRIDLTHSIVMQTMADAQAVLSELQLITAEHWGRPVAKHGTVYFGNKKRLQLKFYEKSQECARGKHKILINLPIIRIELTVGREHLRENGWRQYMTLDKRLSEHQNMTQRLRINELETVDLSAMPKKLQRIYGIWKSGADLRQLYKTQTLYNYASELRAYGVDIWQLHHESNVVQFRRVLQSRPLTFADVIGMGLDVYQPRTQCAA